MGSGVASFSASSDLPLSLSSGYSLRCFSIHSVFGDDVPRNETVPYLVSFHHGVVEDTAFKLFKQFPPADVAQALHIFQIHLPELVQ